MSVPSDRLFVFGRYLVAFSAIVMPYRFVVTIINTIAAIESRIPMTTLVVKASPKTSVPTRMAVIGSNTPSTEAFVAPILRVAMANVAVETIVGKRARPMRFIQAIPPSMPVVMPPSENRIFVRKTMAPTVSA